MILAGYILPTIKGLLVAGMVFGAICVILASFGGKP